MPLSLVKTGTSLLYGAVDIAAEYADNQMQLTNKPFQNATDISRAVVAVGGAAAAYMTGGTLSEVGEALELSAIPLLEKSIANAVISFTGITAPHFQRQAHGQLMLKREGYRTTLGQQQPQRGLTYRATLGA